MTTAYDDRVARVVKHRLRDGYGSEDVALLEKLPLARVRSEIAHLRKIGWLDWVFSAEEKRKWTR